MRSLTVLGLAAALATANAQPATPDAERIVRLSLDRDSSNFEQARNYIYRERTETREFDKAGDVASTESEAREVMTLAGRPYRRLIERNGRPLPPAAERKEKEKMEREIARSQDLSPKEREKLNRERAEERKYLKELPDAFRFRLLGEDRISGEPVWIIEAEPKAGYHPREFRARILTGMSGKVWIGKADYQWVKAEIEVNDPISLGFSLLRISPGGSISFEQTRVNDEIWLPMHVNIRADARVVFVKKMRTEIDITYSDYRKFQADSKVRFDAR